MAERWPCIGLSILVVDESPYLGDVLVSALEHEGCAATVARSAAEALLLARVLEPDLITVDMGPDGEITPDLVGHLTVQGVPLILIAPNAGDPQLRELSATRVFGKPFYLSQVVAAVLETLGRAAHP
jgi:two-component system capsular synthesis sensor histidine kinase RcsC